MKHKIKYQSGYKRPSLKYRPNPYERDKREQVRGLAYIMLLLGREAPHSDSPWPADIENWIAEQPMAQAIEERIACQQEELSQKSYHACKRAGELICEYGFGYSIFRSTCYIRLDGSWSDTPIPHIACVNYGDGGGYYTDGQRFVYIGPRRAQGYEAQQRKPIQIIIAEGRDPDDAEIRAMITEALGEQLSLAA